MKTAFSLPFLALAAPLLVAAAPTYLPTLTLVYPNQRYVEESCTPHNTLNGTSPVDLSSLPRIPFPLNGETTLSLNVETTKPGNLSVGVSMWGEENPDTIPEAIGTVPWGEKSVEGTGAYCFPLSTANLVGAGESSSITNGTIATLSLFFTYEQMIVVQCADIVLVENYTAPKLSCPNTTSATTASNTTSTPTNTTTPKTTSGGLSTLRLGEGTKQFAAAGAMLALLGSGLLW